MAAPSCLKTRLRERRKRGPRAPSLAGHWHHLVSQDAGTPIVQLSHSIRDCLNFFKTAWQEEHNKLTHTQLGTATPNPAQVSNTRRAVYKAKEYGFKSLLDVLLKENHHLENDNFGIAKY